MKDGTCPTPLMRMRMLFGAPERVARARADVFDVIFGEAFHFYFGYSAHWVERSALWVDGDFMKAIQ